MSLPPKPPAKTRCGGILRRGTAWRLTRRGWTLLLLVCLIGLAGLLKGIYPFLAVHAGVPADVLVVEGWAADYAMRAAVQEFNEGGYSRLYVTGGPMERGAPLSEYQNYAALGAAVLGHFGAPASCTLAVPAPQVRRDRTYASALALRDWLEAHGESPRALNVLTVGPHARRSRLLYEKAFGTNCHVGVIPVEPEDYDSRCWWAYSAGVRTVMGETAGYLYVRLFFRVSADHRPGNNSGEDPPESSP